MGRFKLEALPYAYEALEPHISKETIEYHYGKHHKAYVDNLNKLIMETEFEELPIEKIIQNSTGGIFNNAAQTWNHNIYWNSFSPDGGGEPFGKILSEINMEYGSYSKFKEAFTKACMTLFGSGWVWLIKNEKEGLDIIQTYNADNPLREGKQVLLACDVWEHSYYIDRRNNRGQYIDAFWNIVNWESIGNRL